MTKLSFKWENLICADCWLHTKFHSYGDLLSSDDFCGYAESIIFNKQKPEFDLPSQQSSTKKSLADIFLSGASKLKEALLKWCTKVLPFSLRYGLFCLWEAYKWCNFIDLELPHIQTHPKSILNGWDDVVGQIDTYSEDRLLNLKKKYPKTKIAWEDSFSKEQIYSIYHAVDSYWEVLSDVDIEIRPAKKWKILEKVTNTMRSVSVPRSHTTFHTSWDILSAIKAGFKTNERVQITRINTSGDKNVTSAWNLEELGCNLAGIYCHELAHVRQWDNWKEMILKFNLKYLTNKTRRTELEKINDTEAIMMGYGLDLYQFKMIVDANSSAEFVERKFEEYLVPKQILRLIFYIQKMSMTLYGRWYFDNKTLDGAWKLLKSEDRKDIEKYKFDL